MNNHVEELSLNKIFCENNDKYIIPIYQRNYAWKYSHVSQLVRDVVDYKKKYTDKKYYIGTLITFQREDDLYEVIDGQQRLTTLSLVLDALKHDKKVPFDFQNVLDFDSRKESSAALKMLYSKPLDNREGFATEICDGYDNAAKALELILTDEGLSFEDFKDYLLKNVIIFRVQVPEDTDLNHYFEIMNNRGEQLEKHEILKSYFIERLKTDKDAQYAFSEIWEKCSNLDRYIQMLFTTNSKNPEKDIRSKIFGFSEEDENKWNFLQPKDDVYKALKAPDSDGNKTENTGLDILQIIGKKQIELSKDEDEGNVDDSNRRFSSLITFPNFLLIVLRIQTGNSSIPLDDKQLIDAFDKYVKDASIESVKDFGYSLLRCKFLFDKYIIKREGDSWSLSKLYYPSKKVNYKDTTFAPEVNGPETSRITQMLSVFHVSVPSQGYKYWIYAALRYFYKRSENSVKASEYLNFLENLAKAYFFDRYIAKAPISFEQIVDQNDCASKNNDLEWERLDKGTAVDNFVFNYMDYLLWTDCKYKHKYFSQEIKASANALINAYQFGYHSSVEHYYPQHPIDDPDHTVPNVNNFGNLCLISGGDNSRLSNHLPKAKKDFYSKPKEGQKITIDSIKQRLMMDYEDWNKESINEHGELMKKILADRTLIGT